eukprot:scaffold11557_cov141-Skeletonema_marinoi.AAC.2
MDTAVNKLTELYVGGLSPRVDNREVLHSLREFGPLVHISRPNGSIAFVTMTTANAYSAVQYGGFPDGMRVGLARKPKPMHFSIRIDDLDPYACRAHLNGHCSLEEEGCPFRCSHPLHREGVDYITLLSGTRESDQKKKKKRRKLNSDNLRNEDASSSNFVPTTITPDSSFERALLEVGSGDDITPSSSFEQEGSQSDRFSNAEDVTDSSEYENETDPSSHPTEYLDSVLSKSEDCSCKEASCLECFSRAKKQLDEQKSDESAESLTSTTSLPSDYNAMNATGQAESIFGGANFTNMPCTEAEDDCGDNCRHPSDDMDPSERAGVEDRYERRPRFTPTRSSDPPDDWESIYGITYSELEDLRAKALMNLEPFRKDCPDLVYYLSELIKIVVPGDRMFFILLHCAVQMSKGLINANCGGSHAFGEDIDLASLGNCSLEALNALSEYFEPFSTINMGSIAKAIGAINGRQDLCPTTTRKFSPCDPLADKDPLPDKVLDVLRIAFGHFEAVKANALMFSAAGTTTNVNERILLKLAPSFEDSEHVSIPEILMNHIQFFRRAFPSNSSLVDTYTKMSANFQRLSECISSHLMDKCDVIPAKSLFDHGCDSNDLPMIGRDPNATEASLEMLVGSAGQARKDAIRTYCISHPDSPASKGPSVVRGYAFANLEHILKCQREHLKNGRVDFIPETFEDVLCWHILSNMGTNSWDKLSEQEKNERVNAMHIGRQEKSRKRERGETDVSDDVSGDVSGGKIQRVRVKRCSVPNCPRQAKQGGVCITHAAKVRKKKKCSVPNCPRQVHQGGVCITHGSKVRRCSVPNCPRQVQQGGVCITHGAKVQQKKMCSVPNCPRRGQQGGVCITHGAKVRKKKKCSVPNCPRQAKQGGVCITHRAKQR